MKTCILSVKKKYLLEHFGFEKLLQGNLDTPTFVIYMKDST